MMATNGRHTQPSGTKCPHVPHPVEGHEAGAAGAQGHVGGGVSLSSPQQGAVRQARPGLSRPKHSSLHPRVLLARPFVSEGQDPCPKQSFLAGKIPLQQGSGQAECPAASARGVVRANRMGVLPLNGRVAELGDQQVVGCLVTKTLTKGVKCQHFTLKDAPMKTGGAAILEADSHVQAGDASGGDCPSRVSGLLAKNLLSPPMDNLALSNRPTFIDLFSGCGGLSLGLSQAGWQGLFAIERAADAFETFRANFLDKDARHGFQWPDWLEQAAHSIDDVLAVHQGELKDLRGKVDLIAGGPPCQGFSFSGKRNSSDPRNRLFQRYVSFVELINPKFLVLENVPGMNVAHTQRGNKTKTKPGQTYYDKLRTALGELGYAVDARILDAVDHGVPQRRSRLVVIGIRSDIAMTFPAGCTGVFNCIDIEGNKQLSELGGGKPVTAQHAISDLRVGTRRTVEYTGFGARRGYVQLKYQGTSGTAYQRLMNEGVAREQMDSMRLARHKEEVEARFQQILDCCRRGVNLSKDDREYFGMLKHRTVPMSPTQPAPTLTTLPDDILHYKDPRILTVRECARLQSFPDWFTFHGKYTTGGDRRKVECPRYTQVGNAVPPLLAQAIGTGILGAWKSIEAKAKGIGKKTVIKKHVAMA